MGVGNVDDIFQHGIRLFFSMASVFSLALLFAAVVVDNA
jgi:hypothetical protein